LDRLEHAYSTPFSKMLMMSCAFCAVICDATSLDFVFASSIVFCVSALAFFVASATLESTSFSPSAFAAAIAFSNSESN